jgi:Mg2+ and Co2+ transporter CorA
VLKEIDENNDVIHDKHDSDGKMTENLEEDKKQVAAWKKNENEMEDMIEEIINGVKVVKGKVVTINQAQDIINEKTGKADEKVGKLSTRIQGDN